MRSFSILSLLAWVLVFAVMALRTTEAALPWKVHAAANEASPSVPHYQVTSSHQKVGRTIEFLAFNDARSSLAIAKTHTHLF